MMYGYTSFLWTYPKHCGTQYKLFSRLSVTTQLSALLDSVK